MPQRWAHIPQNVTKHHSFGLKQAYMGPKWGYFTNKWPKERKWAPLRATFVDLNHSL